MPRGYPDYFGQSVFPKYGTASLEAAMVNAVADDETELIKIEGKGRTYGGVVISPDPDLKTTSRVRIYIDDELFFNWSIHSLYLHGFTSMTPLPESILCYDPTSPNYAIGIEKDLTFEQSFALKFDNTAAAVITIAYYMYYSLIK